MRVGGQTYILSERGKKRLKSEERKTSKKQSERELEADGNRDQHIERERKKRGTDVIERKKKCLNDMRGIRKSKTER